MISGQTQTYCYAIILITMDAIHIYVIVMFMCLFIQQLYSLSDEQLERELVGRISFRMFLGTTEVVPDSTTIWKFGERLTDREG